MESREEAAAGTGLEGKHLKCKYDNGWSDELYYRAGSLLDYRIVEGDMKGQCVKHQAIQICSADPSNPCFRVSWVEANGSCVSQFLDLKKQEVYATLFVPQWVLQSPQDAVCFQDDRLPSITARRDAGPTYPIHILSLSGKICFSEHLETDDDQLIQFGKQ